MMVGHGNPYQPHVKELVMVQPQNPALVALSLALEDASRKSGTSAYDILVHKLELRPLTTDPTPLPPAFFIDLGEGTEYVIDSQGNILQGAGDLTDRELRIRFTQTGGIAGWTSTYEADDSTLSVGEASYVRQQIEETDFFNLPDEVPNGDPIPDLYSYTIWIAHGRRDRELRTYDGSGPHQSPALEKLIEWLKDRAPQLT
jgi:hypothetical protein